MQGAADRGDRLAHLVGDPAHVPQQERAHASLDGRARRPLGPDGNDGIDEGGGVDHPQGLFEVPAPAGDRGVGQEELVELALELGGKSPEAWRRRTSSVNSSAMTCST